jgi:hypothetical protein
MSVGARRRAHSGKAHEQPDPEEGGCLGNRLHLYYWTGLHATNLVIAPYFIL